MRLDGPQNRGGVDGGCHIVDTDDMDAPELAGEQAGQAARQSLVGRPAGPLFQKALAVNRGKNECYPTQQPTHALQYQQRQ